MAWLGLALAPLSVYLSVCSIYLSIYLYLSLSISLSIFVYLEPKPHPLDHTCHLRRTARRTAQTVEGAGRGMRLVLVECGVEVEEYEYCFVVGYRVIYTRFFLDIVSPL